MVLNYYKNNVIFEILFIDEMNRIFDYLGRQVVSQLLFSSRKHIIFSVLSILLGSSGFSYAQNFSNHSRDIEAFKRYLTDNILQLDPIEGIYDSHSVIQHETINGSHRLDDVYEEICVFRVGKNQFAIIENATIRIERVGETNAYSFIGKSSDGDVKDRVLLLNNGFHFVWDSDIQSEWGSTTSDRIHRIRDCIKSFPTHSMYLDAFENQQNAKPVEWSGTGFALKDGLIVTNYHVVDGAQTISVHGVIGNLTYDYPASIVAIDKTNDLAIIRIQDPGFLGGRIIPYTIKDQQADVGEAIWVLGYPLAQVLGDEIKLTNGIVSSRSGYQGDISTYQITAPVQPGNSGGPLFDSKGNIIGIVNAGVSNADNVGYAIKASYLLILAESYSLSASLPTRNTLSGFDLKDQVKKVKDFVFLVICSSGEKEASSPQGYFPPSYQTVDSKPKFKGGDTSSFSNWVNSQLVYPETARKKGITGVVRLRFTVDIDGTVTNVHVIQGVHPLLDAEAVRVVKSSPKWTPAVQNGDRVKVIYTFPIVFALN